MKGLSIEEKAKAYDEAIEKARKLATDLPNGRNDRLYHVWDLESIFPELVESEDERIRKELIEHVKDQQSSFISAPDCRDKYEEEENNKYNSWLAWLEKQGEQKPTIEMKSAEESLGIDSETYNKIVDECIYSEQKPACSDDKKLTDVNHEYYSELLENNNSKDINDYVYQVAYCMSHDWIEETATWDDVQKACKLGAEWKEKHCNNSSTAWSEEDENTIKVLMNIIKKSEIIDSIIYTDSLKEKLYDWLKSLRPQNHWKPSDEQLNNLKQAINAFPYETDYLELLYDDLKKLKGE